MRFRLTALGLHLLASCIALTLILGTLYFAWYRWPGWYLTDVAKVIGVMVGVDVVLGPLLTFLIASPKKPRRELVRDIAMIATVQLCALVYGGVSLWNGRPLYYAFSEDVLQLVQAYDINAEELALARQQKAPLVPHWYSLPRWIWAPLPQDPEQRQKIVGSAISGGDDVISMPRYYQPWDAGEATLRTQLKKVDDVKYFYGKEKKILKERMQAAGIATDQPNSIPLSGRGHPVLVVFDPASLKIAAILTAK
jgi:hypothetical protein